MLVAIRNGPCYFNWNKYSFQYRIVTEQNFIDIQNRKTNDSFNITNRCNISQSCNAANSYFVIINITKICTREQYYYYRTSWMKKGTCLPWNLLHYKNEIDEKNNKKNRYWIYIKLEKGKENYRDKKKL